MKRFNPKQYRGKIRIYTPVPNAPRVSRLWVWDGSEYVPPASGKSFFARRYEKSEGRTKRTFQFFTTLEEARTWQYGNAEQDSGASIEHGTAESPIDRGPLFGKVIADWQERSKSKLQLTTRIRYGKIVELYFGEFFDAGIYELTSKRIDRWVSSLKDPKGPAMKSNRRKSFRHELECLSGIFRFYEEYSEDPKFRFPIRKRHFEDVELNRPYVPKSKDLSPQEFQEFAKCLRRGRHGEMFFALATTQYVQALRISEAAALFHEDALIDTRIPHSSRLKIVRKVVWPRKKGLASFVTGGFKNAEANEGIKEQPMFPETYEALLELWKPKSSGLIFQIEGSHIEYRQIQYAYDQAFKAAGLPYTATHVMRHGGCRAVYNERPDNGLAAQLLGNSDRKSIETYAKRHAGALTQLAREHWEKKYSEIGCKWLQPKQRKENVQ